MNNTTHTPDARKDALNKPVVKRKNYRLGTIKCAFCQKEINKGRKNQMFCSSYHLKLYYSNILFKPAYVTIKEFIDNGGILEQGRPIYNEDCQLIGEYLEIYKEGNCHLAKNGSLKSFPISEMAFYIKINCKPIYK